MDLLISSGVFALVLVLSLVIFTGGRREDDKVKAREMLERVTRPETDDSAAQLLRQDRRHHVQRRVLFNPIYRLNPSRRLEENMWQAGIYMHVSEMMLIIVLLFGAGTAVGQLVLRDPWFALIAGVSAGALPLVYIRLRRKRRMRAFAMQLPFALDLIKSSLEAGHSLLRGLQVLVQEFTDPLGGEFRTVLEQARLGMPLPRAFDDLLGRVPEEDLRLLVVAVKVQSEVGSSLAQIIGRLSEIVRTRQRLQAQIRAMTAQSRMSGMIVGLLPIIVLSVFSLIQPSYTHVLFYNPTGIKVVKAAIVLDAMAFFTIRRILRIDY
jgi:tight adherence protein B